MSAMTTHLVVSDITEEQAIGAAVTLRVLQAVARLGVDPTQLMDLVANIHEALDYPTLTLFEDDEVTALSREVLLTWVEEGNRV